MTSSRTPGTQSTPYGAWPSPFSARDTVTAGTARSVPVVAGRSVWWLEARPTDGGRLTLVRGAAGGEPQDVSPVGANVRTGYLEYGGGAVGVALADPGEVALYVDFADQRVHRVDVEVGPEGPVVRAPRPITPDLGGSVRWSCFRVDVARGAVFCLREDRRDDAVEPVVSLVRLALDGPNDDLGVELVAGRRRPTGDRTGDQPGPDFVSDPALSPDRDRVAWVQWDHPEMAWTGTTLWVGDLDEAGDLHGARAVRGGPGESVEQPGWLPDGRLVCVSDASGWSNLYTVDVSDGGADDEATALTASEHDHGQPRWTPDQSSYGVLPDGRVVTTRFTDGLCVIGLVDPVEGADGGFREVPTDVTGVFDLRAVGEHHATCRATFADRPADVVTIDLHDGTVRSVADAPVGPDPAWVSRPEPVSWRSDPDLGGDGETAYGFLYPPTNPDAVAPDGDLPPLVVTLHGGPTAAAPAAFTRARTFWTSRGFAVLDVNYAGSTGHGRAYRQRLDGAWGVAEVADVASGARHLAAAGRVDGTKVTITGGSAGGYTTLAALTFTDVFAAGASHFGVSDLAALAAETHKLESRYLDGLVAPWPEGEAVYAERSPIHHVDRLATPLVLLQGTEDKVVPPNQAETMFDAVRAKGLPVALVVFEGEGHGFRDPANQARALECELSFYGQVLGFTPAGDVEPVEVENLP